MINSRRRELDGSIALEVLLRRGNFTLEILVDLTHDVILQQLTCLARCVLNQGQGHRLWCARSACTQVKASHVQSIWTRQG